MAEIHASLQLLQVQRAIQVFLSLQDKHLIRLQKTEIFRTLNNLNQNHFYENMAYFTCLKKKQETLLNKNLHILKTERICTVTA